jgi:hypothetical protein
MEKLVIKNRKYNAQNFASAEANIEIVKAKSKYVKEGDWIVTQDNESLTFSIFIVDYIDRFFSDIVTEEMLQQLEKEIPYCRKNVENTHNEYPDEWSKFEFTFEDNGGSKGLAIQEIPYDAEFLVIRNK